MHPTFRLCVIFSDVTTFQWDFRMTVMNYFLNCNHKIFAKCLASVKIIGLFVTHLKSYVFAFSVLCYWTSVNKINGFFFNYPAKLQNLNSHPVCSLHSRQTGQGHTETGRKSINNLSSLCYLHHRKYGRTDQKQWKKKKKTKFELLSTLTNTSVQYLSKRINSQHISPNIKYLWILLMTEVCRRHGARDMFNTSEQYI